MKQATPGDPRSSVRSPLSWRKKFVLFLEKILTVYKSVWAIAYKVYIRSYEVVVIKLLAEAYILVKWVGYLIFISKPDTHTSEVVIGIPIHIVNLRAGP